MITYKAKYKRIFARLKAIFMQDVKKSGGMDCPCCGQFAKVYTRKMPSSAVIGLIKLYKLGSGFHHVSELGVSGSGGSFALLRHWGLIEAKPNDDSGKRCSGWWKLDFEGELFVKNILEKPSHIVLYNNEIIGKSDECMDIEQTLGNKFNYAELMNK